MPYVTGGAAFGDVRASQPGFSGDKETNVGWTVGGGLEFAIAGNWTAKAEYLYVNLGDIRLAGLPAAMGSIRTTCASAPTLSAAASTSGSDRCQRFEKTKPRTARSGAFICASSIRYAGGGLVS